MIKTRTFKQIIDEGVDGVWKSEEGDVLIKSQGNISLRAKSDNMNIYRLFSLEKAEVPFMRAIGHYNKGGDIQSVETGKVLHPRECEELEGITVKEILGGWYLYG